MIRFISHLIGKPYESCKACEVLKQQLVIANAEKKELTDTLLGLIKPTVYEKDPTPIEPVAPKVGLWSRRRGLLEEQDRIKARTIRESPHIAKPDSAASNIAPVETVQQANRQMMDDKVRQLEEELGIEETKE